MKRYYIAYGSNLNVNQMKRRCPSSVLLGTATLKGYELIFKISKTGAYLTIEPCENGEVPVAVWEVTKADEEMLDRCEGYPIYYDKQEFKLKYTGVRTGRKRSVSAFAYIMQKDRPIGIPSNSYFATCLFGYNTFRFDKRILHHARSRSIELVTGEPNICPFCGNLID